MESCKVGALIPDEYGNWFKVKVENYRFNSEPKINILKLNLKS